MLHLGRNEVVLLFYVMGAELSIVSGQLLRRHRDRKRGNKIK